MSRPTLEEIRDAFGTSHLTSTGTSVGQDQIDSFAEVTLDDDWMHTDPKRAREAGLGGTIAFGFWTLSLLTYFLRDALGTAYPLGARLGFNYGLDRVRFLSPIPVGSRVRGHLRLSDVREKSPGRILLTLNVDVEREGQTDPAMVATWLVLLVFGDD